MQKHLWLGMIILIKIGSAQRKYDDRFYRMWRYYLFSFMGMFEIRYINLWQIVISKRGRKDRYDRPHIL